MAQPPRPDHTESVPGRAPLLEINRKARGTCASSTYEYSISIYLLLLATSSRDIASHHLARTRPSVVPTASWADLPLLFLRCPTPSTTLPVLMHAATNRTSSDNSATTSTRSSSIAADEESSSVQDHHLPVAPVAPAVAVTVAAAAAVGASEEIRPLSRCVGPHNHYGSGSSGSSGERQQRTAAAAAATGKREEEIALGPAHGFFFYIGRAAGAAAAACEYE